MNHKELLYSAKKAFNTDVWTIFENLFKEETKEERAERIRKERTMKLKRVLK